MEHLVTRPPDEIDKEMLDAICDHCQWPTFCSDLPGCCPVPRIRRLEPRAQVPDSELLTALDEARRFLKEYR